MDIYLNLEKYTMQVLASSRDLPKGYKRVGMYPLATAAQVSGFTGEESQLHRDLAVQTVICITGLLNVQNNSIKKVKVR